MDGDKPRFKIENSVVESVVHKVEKKVLFVGVDSFLGFTLGIRKWRNCDGLCGLDRYE